ncbi:MAG: DoxX family protein [Bacteroidetes bacterium]|nr:DoxX family protein [Bacteroidota bacterium]
MKPILVKIAFFILSSLMGLVFLFSGYTKLYPIEPFEFTFVDLGIGGWYMAPFIARFMIGLEFLIGFLLIFGLFMRFSLKLTIGSLIFFSVYLIFIMINNGNNGNCGCFGQALVMTPLQALIKNAIMLAVCFVIYKFYDGFNYGKAGKWIFGILFITAFALPHILNYVDFSYSQSYLTKQEDHFKLELDSVYSSAKIHKAPRTLSTGKHVIAFMSMSCPHCRIAAKKMRLIKEQNPNISMYLILNGEYDMLKPFFEDTKARNIDYCVLNGRNFIYLAGLNLPVIYLVNNSVVEADVNYMELDQTEIEKWLAKP